MHVVLFKILISEFYKSLKSRLYLNICMYMYIKYLLLFYDKYLKIVILAKNSNTIRYSTHDFLMLAHLKFRLSQNMHVHVHQIFVTFLLQVPKNSNSS